MLISAHNVAVKRWNLQWPVGKLAAVLKTVCKPILLIVSYVFRKSMLQPKRATIGYKSKAFQIYSDYIKTTYQLTVISD